MKYSLGEKSLIFKYISINLKNVYLSTIQVSNEYTLDLAKHIYNYLKIYYPKNTIKVENASVENVEDIAEYFLHGHDRNDLSDSDIGATIKPTILDADLIQNADSLSDTNYMIYDNNSKTIPESISNINKYNIIDWPINDSVIQFLQPGVVISDNSDIDEIAYAQYSLCKAGYVIPKLKNSQIEDIGKINEEFKLYCYKIQQLRIKNEKNVVATGYYDMYVESYTRGLSEVRN